MEEWKECRLGDYCDFQNGYAFKSSEFKTNGEYKIVKIKELKDGLVKFFDDSASVDIQGIKEFEKYKIYRNDVLFALTGDPVSKPNPLSWVGRVSIYRSDENALLNQRTCKIKKSERIDNKFLYYYFRQWENFYALASKATGSASQANISTNTIADTIIKLPPLLTQQKIAAILSSLDDKIELNNKINTNLEQQAQALFKNWFVDFEPFGGKMPEGWKVGKLSDIAEITSGKRPPMKQSDYSKDVSIPLVGAASVMGYTNQVLYNEPILITGRVGTHGVIQRFSTECWPSDNTLVVKSQYYEYVYQIMCNIDYDNMNRGSTQPLITQSDLGKVECIIPDEGNLNKFEQLTNNLFAKVQENQLENQKLANIRDTLLPKLMNGEIEV